MPSYKLHYFNGRGRAELTRLILTAAGQKFEDYRIDFKDWPAKKPEYPYGKLPLLEVDGEKLNQSVAIAHFVAQQHGLAGKTPLDAAKCHAKVEQIRDLMETPMGKIMAEKDEKKRPEVIKAVKDDIASSLATTEEMAKKHMDKSGFAVAGQLTYADLACQNATFTLIQLYGEDFIKQYPTLHKHYTFISGQPKIKEYLAARAVTPF